VSQSIVYRADVVGSLLRPDYLKQGRQALETADMTPEEFGALQDRAADEAIALQQDVGLPVVNDGEVRRLTFIDQLFSAVDGIGPVDTPWKSAWQSDAGESEFGVPLAVTGKIRRRGSFTAIEYGYAKERAKRPVKITLPSPLMMAYLYSPVETAAVYPDPFEMFADAVTVIREEIAELIDLGCRYIQIDAPELAVIGTDERWAQDFGRRSGLPVDRMLTESAELLNAVVDGLGGASYGLHLCRGNNEGRWMASGGYDRLAREVLPRLSAFDRFLLEFDDERSGGFESLAQLPEDKVIVLGVVSTKRPELEVAGELVAKVEEAARFFPKEHLAVSTQCGFASMFPGNPTITPDIQRAKLELVVALANEIWGETETETSAVEVSST